MDIARKKFIKRRSEKNEINYKKLKKLITMTSKLPKMPIMGWNCLKHKKTQRRFGRL